MERVPGFSPPRVKLLRSVRPATSRAVCALRLHSARSALALDEFLPASTRLVFREREYHLMSRRPCTSAAGMSLAARYDVYRTATALGEYHSPN